MLKAPAGAGKNTIMMEYIFKCFENGYKRIVYVLPKNSLLEQQINIMNKELIKKNINDIKICKNFGKKTFYNKKEYEQEDKVVIYSSTPKVKYCDDTRLINIR